MQGLTMVDGPEGHFFIHPSVELDGESSTWHVGEGTVIWRFTHVRQGSRIGRRCVIGQNCYIDRGAIVGDGCRLANNVSVYDGVELDDFVFCGPSAVFTHVTNPRAEVCRRGEFKKTRVRRGATIGANATIVAGSDIGRYAFVAAGAVVTRTILPDYVLVAGNPARLIGWCTRHGQILMASDALPDGRTFVCPQSHWRYEHLGESLRHPGALRCLDFDEDTPLPEGRI